MSNNNQWSQSDGQDNNPANFLPAEEIKNLDQRYLSTYMSKVYGWMFLALCVTAGIAFLAANSPAVLEIVARNRFVFFALILAQLGLVVFLSARIMKMSSATATMVFLLYAALNGLIFSFILLVYDPGSIVKAFAVTAGTFGIMSFVGYTTKTDLTKFGRLMLMALIGIILASVVNIFLHSPGLDYVISYIGVAVFVGLIAYDTQKIKAYAFLAQEEDRKRGAIMGALALYLDFINLFLFILRIFGGRR